MSDYNVQEEVAAPTTPVAAWKKRAREVEQEAKAWKKRAEDAEAEVAEAEAETAAWRKEAKAWKKRAEDAEAEVAEAEVEEEEEAAVVAVVADPTRPAFRPHELGAAMEAGAALLSRAPP